MASLNYAEGQLVRTTVSAYIVVEVHRSPFSSSAFFIRRINEIHYDSACVSLHKKEATTIYLLTQRSVRRGQRIFDFYPGEG